jgi:hypothetical protein
MLVVLLCCNALDFQDLWLQVLLPLSLSIRLGLRDAWSAILGSQRRGGRDNPLVERVVVWASRVNVWTCVFIVVWPDVRRNDGS